MSCGDVIPVVPLGHNIMQRLKLNDERPQQVWVQWVKNVIHHFSTFLSIIFHVESCLEEKEIFIFFLEYDSLKTFNILHFVCPYTGASEAAHVNNSSSAWMRNQGSQLTRISSEIGKHCIWKQDFALRQKVMVNTVIC